MLGRRQDLATIRSLLKLYPVVAILGARQVGKTTVARELSRARNPGSTLFDLENSRDAGKLADAATALEAMPLSIRTMKMGNLKMDALKSN